MDDSQAGMTPGTQSPYPQQPGGQIPAPPTGPVLPPTGDSVPAGRSKWSRQSVILLWLSVVAVVVLLIVLYLIGDLDQFMQIGILFLPLAVLAALAYVGRNNIVGAVFAYVALAIVGLGVIVYSLANLLFGYVVDWQKFSAILAGQSLAGADLTGIFAPAAGPGLLWALLLYMLSALVAAAMLLRPVRKLVSRIMPIDPDNFVHKIALSILTLLLLTSFIPLIVLGGEPPLLNIVNNPSLESSLGGQSIAPQPLDLVYQFIWTIPATFVVAGWPIARRFPNMLKRLGLVRPTLQQVGFGVGFGVLLAVAAMFVIDPGIHWIWQSLGWQTTDTAAFEKLLGNLVTPVGAVLIGITAGLGEELAVRGLLQPRIGLIASNLVFTGFHASQYGVDALLSVFIIGLILGVVRARSNTTTSAIVHGVYDFVLVLTSALLAGQ
ncbi:MAG: type II CAAX endopeptidase family protein [Chloroflexota bacterium]